MLLKSIEGGLAFLFFFFFSPGTLGIHLKGTIYIRLLVGAEKLVLLFREGELCITVQVWGLGRFEVAVYIVWRGVCMRRTSRERAGWSSSLLEEGCLHSSIQVESQVAKFFPMFPAFFPL